MYLLSEFLRKEHFHVDGYHLSSVKYPFTFALFRIVLNLKLLPLKNNLTAIVALLLINFAFASNGEQSRVLVHTLNYISHDYQFAVANGKVIDDEEYEEAEEFGEAAVKYFNQLSNGWSVKDSVEIRSLVYSIDSLIGKRAAFEVVSPLASLAKNKVIAASGLVITPTASPNLQNGKIVFKTDCSKCHGDAGQGDGPEGAGLNPKPRNFMDNDHMKTISPFTAFNAIRLGVEGTGMKSHPQLDDKDVWDVAFYIISLRYQTLVKDAYIQTDDAKKIIAGLPLSKIAVSADEELIPLLQIPDPVNQHKALAAIRLNQPKTDESDYINTALKYLASAMDLYQQGKYSEASQLAALSYLEGIEPIENQLKSTDPELLERLEKQMLALRKMMSAQNPAMQVKDSLNEVRVTIGSISKTMNKQQYSFWMALLLSASILLREGLEAFLVIMVILSVLKATGINGYKRWIHAGWVSAVLFGLVLWAIGGSFLSANIQYAEMLEGVVSCIAVGMLLYVGFWLHGKNEIGKWKDYVNKQVKDVSKSGSMIGLAGLSFLVVFREVFESVLFLSALHVESGAKYGNAIIVGVVVAFIVVLALATLMLQFSTKLPVTKLFKFSSIIMGVLAVILTGKAIHAFQETGNLTIHSMQVMRVELLGIYPTIETCVGQVLIALIVVWMWRKN